MRDTIARIDAVTADRALIGTLTQALDAAGIFVAVELRDGTIALSGEVSSRRERQAALDLAQAVAGPHSLVVDDGIDLIPCFPDSVFGDQGSAGHGAFAYLAADRDRDQRLDAGLEDEPDFAGSVGATDAEEAATEAETYFPPTDPVVRPSTGKQGLTVVGGFGATSMDVERREAGYDRRRDDEITEDIVRELREDALTTDLIIRVDTRDGVVFLRGTVPTLEDAENAEVVASRVGGVKEVREELVVASLRR